jgi:hypothetical protein
LKSSVARLMYVQIVRLAFPEKVLAAKLPACARCLQNNRPARKRGCVNEE